MVKPSSQVLDGVFHALADPTRRAILERLAGGGVSVSELAEPFAMSLPAVSKHLKVLERAGLLSRQREGRVHRMFLEPGRLRDAAEWLEAYRVFWDGQLDALADYLDTLGTDR